MESNLRKSSSRKDNILNCIQWDNKGISHSFVSTRFNKPTFCEFCNTMIWGIVGKQGQACTVCNFTSHHDCVKNVPATCKSNNPNHIVSNKDHDWLDLTPTTPTYCAACRNIIEVVGGKVYCSRCDICIHKKCEGDLLVCCPINSFEENQNTINIAHYWIPGNLSGKCSGCKSNVGASTHLQGWRCYWCKKKICNYKCKTNIEMVSPTCDLGDLRQIKLSPASLILKNADDPSTWKVNVSNDATPIIVFVNPKSGGQIGNEIMQSFKKLLNPHQVFDLTKGGPAPGLNLIANNNDINWRILACGGDGTVAWVLSEIDKIAFNKYPSVSILPLGTGNDLARALGWGKGFQDLSTMKKILKDLVQKAEIINLDRWQLLLSEKDPNTNTYIDTNPKIVNNYFSIGIDAKVALRFHHQRNKTPHYFSSQTVNKIWYAKYGTDALSDGCSGLAESITLTIDGVAKQIPATIEAIVVVNLPSCYGGAFLWLDPNHCLPTNKQSNFNTLSINDNLVEVVGIRNSFHLGQVQTGLSPAIILGQGKEIEIKYDAMWPVQIDGEPWDQGPCIIKIKHYNQRSMLANRESCHTSLKLKKYI